MLLAYKRETFLFPETLIRKVRHLLLPGLYFSLLTIMVFFVVRLITGKDYGAYLLTSFSELIALQYQGAMWFLPCYFCAEIIFLLLLKRATTRVRELMIVLVGFGLSIWMASIGGYSVRISRMLMAVSFIAIGYLACQIELEAIAHGQLDANSEATTSKGIAKNKVLQPPLGSRRRCPCAVLGIVLLCLGFAGSLFNGQVECAGASYGAIPLLFLLNGAAGTFGLACLTRLFGIKIPILEFYGENSLIVLCTHAFYIDLFWMLNSQLFHLSLGAVDARLFALGVVIFEVPTIAVINRYLPWLIGRNSRNA